MSFLNHFIESKFLAILGLLVLIYGGVILSWKIFGAFRVFVWSRIGPERDLAKTYGKWAVITGSTDGIGKEHAKIFAAKGLNLCLISRNKEKLENTAKEIKLNAEVEVKCIQADFTNVNCYDNIKKGISEIEDIGILMNNVGMLSAEWEPFEQQSESFLHNIINVNILSSVMMTRLVLPRMIAKKRGLIVNVSSMSGTCPTPFASVYSGSKAMVSTFSLCLNKELRRHNIRVICLEPFFVRSNMTKHLTEFKTIVPLVAMPSSRRYSQAASAICNLNASLTSSGYWSHGLITLFRETLLSKTLIAELLALANRLKLLGRTRNID